MRWLRQHVLVISLILLTLVLRLPLLNGSFWLDEAAQILESSRPFSQQLQIKDDFQPPLLHLLTYFAQLFSATEWWLRFWGAVLPSLVTTWVMFELCKVWWPRITSDLRAKQIWVAVLLATNSLWVFYSQELRPYSLAVMWCCLSWWLVARLTRERSSSRQLWLGWIFSCVAGLYSTYLFPFVLLSQGLYFVAVALKQPKLWQPFILSCLGIGLGFAPWVPSFLGQLGAGQQLRADLPGWDQVVSTTQLKALPLAFGKFFYGVVDLELNWKYAVSTAVILGLMAWLKLNALKNWTKLSPETRAALWLLAWWIVVPIVLAWIVSFKIPVIQPKRILFVLPALYGFLVILATELQSRFKLNKLSINLGSLLLTSILLINIWSLAQYWQNPFYQRENWRQVHAQLIARYPSERTTAVFSFGGPFAGWQWYDQGQTANISLGYLSKPGSVDVTDKLKHASELGQYVLVFEYLEELTDPRREVKRALQSLGWKEIDAVSAPGVGFVRVYAKPENLLGLNSQIFTSQ